MYWADEPATEQQLIHLRNAGYVVARPLSRSEAARIIREYQRHPGSPAGPPQSPPAPLAAQSRPGESSMPRFHAPEEGVSETTRMQAHNLRAAAERARGFLAANPAAPSAGADLASAALKRQEFWLDTCREVREMHVSSPHVFELYQRHGCRFFAPNHEQAQEVLDALDSAMPVWDRDHPELFYQTLELNFPELVRHT